MAEFIFKMIFNRILCIYDTPAVSLQNKNERTQLLGVNRHSFLSKVDFSNTSTKGHSRKMSSTSVSATGIMNASTTKTTKSVAKKTVKADEPATPVATPAPVAAAPKVKKTKAEVAAPVAAPVVTAPTTETTETAEPAELRLEAEVKSLTSRLLALREVVSELVTESKRLEKKSGKVQKVADKRKRKNKVEGDASKPARVSIFQIPVKISPELCAFMGRPAGSEESRSNVTKYVTTYVKENNLKNKHDINPDAKLRSLLRVPTTDKLTYFNLQKFLNVHYIKAVPATTTA
jgi:chromatin remodeling complex protein RSC6